MPTQSPEIYIISGGVGSSGEYLVNTVLAQYPEAKVKVTIVGSVRHAEQVLETLAQARSAGALVVHTLVEQPLRDLLIEQAQTLGVPTVDLTGPMFDWLTPFLGQQPVGRPGLYRQLRRQYFERVAAIDYTMAHDDGKNPEGWAQADVVLVGVSRVGKTPLSLYLAVLGWKVANYPLVPQLPVPPALFELDPKRVIGITIDFEQLIAHRLRRQANLGVSGPSAYVDPEEVKEELREAKKLFNRAGFQVIDMTDKPIELGADEIQLRVTPRR
jgi:regulator of PEP synthase PpsR (kinase-PPPase family)